MIRITCDGCDKPINRDDDPWFGVDFTAPIMQHPDPVEQMNDADDLMVGRLLSINGDHEFHFCSATCLSGWGFKRTLEDS